LTPSPPPGFFFRLTRPALLPNDIGHRAWHIALQTFVAGLRQVVEMDVGYGPDEERYRAFLHRFPS
jgi:hypothetical protein